MKKYMIRKMVCLMMAALSIGSFAACGDRPSGQQIDKSKTQIYVGMYYGGLGYEWMEKVGAAFEAKYPQYQVVIDKNKGLYDASRILNNITSYQADIFILDYVTNDIYKSFVEKGYAADITDVVVNQTLTEFSETKSIYDKMNTTLQSYYYYDEKCYATPWYQSSYQTIYDKALFREKMLYKDENGDWTDGTEKHLGIDGVESFDDGLPRTMSEYKELIEYMRSNSCGVTPYTLYGTTDYYMTSYLENVYADYEGYNDFLLNSTLNGVDSDLGEITLDNGYLLHAGQKGKEYALDLAYYIAHDKNNYSTFTFSTSQDNVSAQREYLLSAETSRPIGMLVEGGWWETEAKQVFDDMKKQYRDDSYAYGVREFGVMPVPKADDGSSAEGRMIVCTSGRSMKFINGTKSSDAIKNAKLLLKYMHSNEALSLAVSCSNVAVPYEVNLTNEQKGSMTPYARELQEVYETSTVVFNATPACDFLRYEGADACTYLSLFAASDVKSAILMNFLPNSSMTVQDFLECMNTSRKTSYENNLVAYKKRVNG